ncbi:MAG TPA: hypothetical protein VEQ58_21130 [Polyangiaceae bacterium]|nr:hypothetical protein [Polyangiaceae bacterium]
MAWAYGALPWLGALGVALLLGVVVCYWPLRLDVSGRARGEANGAWVVAGGMSLAVVSVAFVWARGIAPRLTVSLFGKKLAWKPEWNRRLSRPMPKRVKAASQRAWSRIDPLDLGLKLLEERRHLRLRYFVVDLSYGFRDPLLTGRLVGALSVLSVVLPAPIEIRQTPRWDFEDGWEISVDGRALLRPWLMALDIAAYVVRTVR